MVGRTVQNSVPCEMNFAKHLFGRLAMSFVCMAATYPLAGRIDECSDGFPMLLVMVDVCIFCMRKAALVGWTF
jgi:hypothetical protein